MVLSNCKNDALFTDERAVTAQKLKSRGIGLMVSAMGILIGLSAGLSSSIGVGSAIAIGIGASVGMFAMGRRMIQEANRLAATEDSEAAENQETMTDV
mmetsp:Transcript_11168/g.13480  ORF Transcript_11168/g.13480 Transcript_11168/m.13480 type:complete len:98 (+) Transcript_11168:89-382(+)